MVLSYFPAIGDADMKSRRSVSVIGPSWEEGGRISVRSTTPGAPLASSIEVTASPIAGKYDKTIDRQSAYEVLMSRADAAAKEAEEAERAEAEAEAREREFKQARRYEADRVGRSTSRSSRSDSVGDKLTKMVVTELTGTTGRRIVRGILGSLFKGR